MARDDDGRVVFVGGALPGEVVEVEHRVRQEGLRAGCGGRDPRTRRRTGSSRSAITDAPGAVAATGCTSSRCAARSQDRDRPRVVATDRPARSRRGRRPRRHGRSGAAVPLPHDDPRRRRPRWWPRIPRRSRATWSLPSTAATSPSRSCPTCSPMIDRPGRRGDAADVDRHRRDDGALGEAEGPAGHRAGQRHPRAACTSVSGRG